MAETEHKIKLIFVINGENVPIETNINAPLSAAAQRALNESGNSGRPLAEWEVRNASGALIDVTRTVKELGLTNGARLFLSLRVGAGG